MSMDFPNKYDIWPNFLSVYCTMRYHGSNVVYTLYYLCGVVLSLKLRHYQPNDIYSFNNLGASFMLPPAVCKNAPVRYKFNSISNDVEVLLGLFHNLNRQPLLGYNKEVY